MKMNSKTMMSLAFLACALAALQLTAHMLSAAAGKSGELVVVDLQELQKSYKQFNDDLGKFDLYQRARAQRFDARRFLKPEEWDEIDALEAKDLGKLKPEEKKRLEDLRGTTERRLQAIRELGAKTMPDDKDKEELKRLSDLQRTNQVRLEELNARLMDEIEKERGRLTEGLQKVVKKSYADLAKERGFRLVLDKAQVQFADDSIDITQDVLKKLNK